MASAQKSHEDDEHLGHQDSGHGRGILGSVKEGARSVLAKLSGGGRPAGETAHVDASGASGQQAGGGAEPEPEDEVLLRMKAAEEAAEEETEAEPEPEPEEDVLLRVKAADHMTGQAFNDVGPMGGEGTGVPRRWPHAAGETGGAEPEPEPEEDVLLRVKAADHMTGQAFNDVGPRLT